MQKMTKPIRQHFGINLDWTLFFPGIIESPNYPVRYPSNAECNWLIKARNSSDVIKIIFVDVQIEESNYCL